MSHKISRVQFATERKKALHSVFKTVDRLTGDDVVTDDELLQLTEFEKYCKIGKDESSTDVLNDLKNIIKNISYEVFGDYLTVDLLAKIEKLNQTDLVNSNNRNIFVNFFNKKYNDILKINKADIAGPIYEALVIGELSKRYNVIVDDKMNADCRIIISPYNDSKTINIEITTSKSANAFNLKYEQVKKWIDGKLVASDDINIVIADNFKQVKQAGIIESWLPLNFNCKGDVMFDTQLSNIFDHIDRIIYDQLHSKLVNNNVNNKSNIEQLIVQEYKTGNITQRLLAEKYKLSLSTVNRIINRCE